MGQARLRGTFEQRQQQALTRKQEVKEIHPQLDTAVATSPSVSVSRGDRLALFAASALGLSVIPFHTIDDLARKAARQ